MQVRGMLTQAELTAAIERDEIDTVIVASCDMQGRLFGKRVSGWYFLEHAHQHGTHFCTYLLGTDIELETPKGYELMTWESGYGDYLSVPDWSTARRIPWLDGTAMVLADTIDESTGEEIPISPRTLLKQQVERCRSLGFEPMMASELEFYLFDESYASLKKKDYRDYELGGEFNEDYQLLQGTKREPFYRLLRNQLSEAGVPIEFSKGEAAVAQHEINIHYGKALEAADRTVLLKHGIKELAIQNSVAATFMSKPEAHWTGSSGHVHCSLASTESGQNLFPDDTGKMSQTMRWFLGGLIDGTRALSLLIAPYINSYKRFSSASWAPVYLVWSEDNRTCGFRMVGHGSSLRIENRFPGSDSNPYLVYAAMLAMGLRGIEQQIEPGDPYKGNGYLATGFPRVPATLSEAISTWEESTLPEEFFGRIVAYHYLHTARLEQEAFDQAVTDWERRRYFERG
ncbi:MAG: glutamine synthetase [Thermomicrobiales bacterium]|nr:glutamine synthetase [Thermomicrobiales bacterium]MCO5220981.1 glutamine synthetase family protein [Thermomicrobiales bacterium]